MRPRFYTAPAQRKIAIPFDQPAPVMGMDGTVPIHNMPPGKAVYLYNLIPSEYGCRSREGYVVWTKNISSGVYPVRSIIPFTTTKLFAASAGGFYDITTQGGDNPPVMTAFTVNTGQAGFISHFHYTDSAGVQSIMAADEENGMFEYLLATNTWVRYTTQITFPGGISPVDIAFVASHKGRIWMIPQNSADAYYLPIGAKNGAASKFQFGSKLKHGGDLIGLYNWSIDGGDGVDDYLLAVSSGGDLLAYRGTDPAVAANWNLVGNWFIGPPPKGRRVAVQSGGDTLLLSSFGLLSVSALLQGVDPTRVERNVTGKITRLVRDAIKEKGDLSNWEVTTIPETSLFIINSPKRADERHIQFVLNLNRLSEDTGGGWGLWRDVPAVAFGSLAGQTYFGTDNGFVGKMQGSVDNTDGTNDNPVPVNFSALLGFNGLEHPAMYKQVQWLRPQFIASNIVEASAKAVYDFKLAESQIPEGLPPLSSSSVWDTGEWGRAIWSGLAAGYVLSGGVGYGRQIAIALQGKANSRVTLTNIEGEYVPWGFL